MILKKILTEIRFDKKITNAYSEGFLLNTNLYKKPNDVANLVNYNHKTEVKSSVDPEDMVIKK